MPEATLIRARQQGERTLVRVLMNHPMESGQRKDEAGAVIPAWYIRDVTVQLGGRTVLTAQWGPSVSANPFLQFVLRGAKPGDRLTVTWLDNRGERRSDEAVVAAERA